MFSSFNQSEGISMFPQHKTLCGITQEESELYFSKPIKEMSRYYGYTVGKMKERLKAQYDGYNFSRNMTGVYNPFRVLNAMK